MKVDILKYIEDNSLMWYDHVKKVESRWINRQFIPSGTQQAEGTEDVQEVD